MNVLLEETVPRELLEHGYKNQICVDFSPVVIKLMAGQSLEGVTWLCEGVRDKFSRALKDTGVFLYITYRQPHFVKRLLNQDNLWDMHMEVLKPSENSFEYYAFVLF
ncbi:hypothetical protein CERZMDRAFT_98170 [Cercospora zeae-maydis SCOH1-5]|uniref:Methyltransferase type 11 domain-containing protein n=1 Tax=Cercospora zeae-maydis SCOH1-5 TaxID=717836 RepID=A0A6A6FE81_9PEZI|nr:hypothetical protein CERZMDRAFT_98170 [Cercospora zeae-maydis SCOH1-5]